MTTQSLEEKQLAIKKDLKTDRDKFVNPELMMWGFVERLTSNKPEDVYMLTELSNEEILCIANYKALSKFLRQQDACNELIACDAFLEWVMRLRPSLQRKSRNELVTILKRKPSYYGTSTMMGMPGDDETGGKKWYEFWKK
jgi:hypothetical protein